MSEPQLTGQELQRMADALPAEFMWGDPLYPLDLREILSAMGYCDLLEALRRCRFDSLNMSTADLEFCRTAYNKAIRGTACTASPSTPS
jgi:hypothetical protein